MRKNPEARMRAALSFLRRSPASTASTLIFLVAAVWVCFNVHRWKDREILQWDTDGYYLYLPAALIHGDLFGLGFLDRVEPNNFNGGYAFGQGRIRVPATGRYCDKYTMGTAVFELPFFLVAHAWCIASPGCVADGYSPPYQLAVALSSACWAWLGLLVLVRFLRRRVDDATAAAAVLVLGLGTNLFFYASLAQGMSHPVLFFLCALLIERTDSWYAGPALGKALAIGLCIGLAVLCRPTAALLALIPLCWSLTPNGLHLLARHKTQLLAAAGLVLLCGLPQAMYWKAATGHYLFYSYGDESFDFLHPHVLQGLFGFRKGWFVYTPAALIALAGLWPLWRWQSARSTSRHYVVMLCCVLVPFIYVAFSWKMWWYGGGFGSRPLIDILPLLALPLATAVHSAQRWKGWLRHGLLATLFLCIALNLFQQWQYKQGIIHYEDMTFTRWVQVFGRTSASGLPKFP